MNRIQHDWNTLKDEKEYEIIRYNTIIGMRYTIVFFGKTSESAPIKLNYKHINMWKIQRKLLIHFWYVITWYCFSSDLSILVLFYFGFLSAGLSRFCSSFKWISFKEIAHLSRILYSRWAEILLSNSGASIIINYIRHTHSACDRFIKYDICSSCLWIVWSG